MQYYNRIDTNKGFDLAINNGRYECLICNCFFLTIDSNFRINGCHDLTMLCLNVSDIAIITVKNVDNRCIIHNISKSEVVNLLENYFLEYCGYT